jgi:hypothetical protein
VADTLTEDIDGARSVVADLEGIGIDLVEAQTIKFRQTQLAAQLAARRPR